MAERCKNVVAFYDYLDGTQGLSINDPEEWHEQVRRVPVSLLKALDDAHAQVNEAERRIMALPEQPNRKYKLEDETPHE